MAYRRLVLLLLAVSLSSCASPRPKPAAVPSAAGLSGRPSWVDGASAEYPRGRFLTGVGSSGDPAEAKDRARAEISKIFSTHISVNTTAVSSEHSSASAGGGASYSSQDVSQKVRAVSDRELEGVEIARTWHDAAYGTHYALAVLERSKALSALRERAGELDSAAKEAAVLLSSAADKLRKAKYALEIMDILKAREAFGAELRVLDPSGAELPEAGVGAARRAAVKALSGLDVELTMTGEKSAAAEAAVIKALNGLGIEARTSSPAGRADMSVECSVRLEAVPDTDPGSRWKWSRGTALVTMKDERTSGIFMNFEVSAREASSTAEEARSKTERTLGRKIGEEIRGGTVSFLRGR